MPRSFFTTPSPTELKLKSDVFSTIIGTDYADLGLTSAQATAYAALNTAYSSAYLLANTAATRTKAAIADRNQAATPLRQKAADLAKIIQGHGVAEGVLVALGLSVRKTPAPVPPPGTPSNLKLGLDGNGSLIMKWKCANPVGSHGTVYQVYRRIGGAGPFDYLGGVGGKKFIDNAIPAGATQITYKIQAVRSTAAGLWAEFNVNFGTNAGGAMTATLTQPSAPKLAA